MPRRYLFVGPSIPDAADIAGPDVVVLPPVMAGDLLSLPLASGDAVGIVDGYFHHRQAVRHKEILAVMSHQVRVLGAASIGALRAAELHQFGMHGVGFIYRKYRDGILEADDEVALMHGEASDGYPGFSVPLVNIRATLAAAAGCGLIDTALAAELVAEMAGVAYPERTYHRLIESAQRHGGSAGQKLARFCRDHPVDQKRDDALALLRELRLAAPATAGAPWSETVYVRRWRREAATVDTGDGHGGLPALGVTHACQLFAADFPAFWRHIVLERIVQECVRECDAAPGRDPVGTAIAHGVHRGLYLDPGGDDGFDFLHQWLTGAERELNDRHAKLAAFLVRSHGVPPGVADLDLAVEATHASAALPAARRLAQVAATVNRVVRQRYPGLDTDQLGSEIVLGWLAEHWGCARGELELAALDRGFDSEQALLAAVRPYFLAARRHTELTGFAMKAAPDGESGGLVSRDL